MKGRGIGLLIFVVALILPQIAISKITEKTISVAEAKELVLAVLPQKTISLPKFGIEFLPDNTAEYSGYYTFVVRWAGGKIGSNLIGYYVVDPETGDVFSGVVGCEEFSTPKLKRLQAKMRHKLGLSEAAYKKIKKNGPLC